MKTICKTKRKIDLGVGLVLLMVLFASCSPEYIPNMVNSPMFSNAGEFQATVATGTSNFDAQAGYAITDHIAIIANGSYADQTNDTTDEFHKHLIVEGGLGYYQKINSAARMEVFGGYGVGKIQTLEDYGMGLDQVDVQFNRIFLQPAIGASTDFFDGSFAARFAMVQMVPENAQTISKSWNAFIEPVITAKMGYKYVKAVIQFGYSFPTNEERIDYNHQRLILNFGLTFNIGRDYTDL
jgi:hypothetical protein